MKEGDPSNVCLLFLLSVGPTSPVSLLGGSTPGVDDPRSSRKSGVESCRGSPNVSRWTGFQCGRFLACKSLIRPAVSGPAKPGSTLFELLRESRGLQGHPNRIHHPDRNDVVEGGRGTENVLN